MQKRYLNICTILLLFLATNIPMGSAADSSSYVGVSENQFFVFWVTGSRGDNKSMGLVIMSISNIRELTSYTNITYKFTILGSGLDKQQDNAVTQLFFTIPAICDPNTVECQKKMGDSIDGILGFKGSWIINKNAIQKDLIFLNGTDQLRISYDDNGILTSFKAKFTINNIKYDVQITQIFTWVHTAAVGGILVAVIVIIIIRKKKKNSEK